MKKSLIKTIALAAGLALAGNAYTQQTKDNSFYNRTGDFMLVSQYMHPLNKEKETSIESLLRGGNVTASYAIDAIDGLNSRIQFLNSARAKNFYSDEERKLLIERYNGFIAEIAKEKRSSNYSKSLEQLSRAANDGTLSPSELKDVEDGIYMLVKEGTDKQVGKYSLYALVNVGLKDSIKQNEVITVKPKEYSTKVKVKEDSVKPEEYSTRKSDKVFTFQDDLFRDIFNSEIKPSKENSTVKPEKIAIKQEIKPVKKSTKTISSLTLGVNSNMDFDNFGASVGFRVYPAGGIVGLGIAADGNFGLDKNIDSYNDVLFDNLSAVGTVDETNKSSIGLSGEMQIGPLFLGGGIDYSNKITEKNVKILEGDEIIKSNSDSVPINEFFGKVYAGLEVPVTKTFGLGALVGYDWEDGLYFGIKSNIKQK
jgi:hypothetical protein